MSPYFTPAHIVGLFIATQDNTKLLPMGQFRFTSRITTDSHGVLREIRCYQTDGKMVWNAFTVDGRPLTTSDLERACTNRMFNKEALTQYSIYNIAVFDPQNLVNPAGADSVATPVNASANRAGMFAGSQHGRMLSNAMPSGFGAAYPTQPGFFPNGPSDFPMSPQFGDFQFPHPFTRDPNHRGLPLPHTSTQCLTKDIPSAETMLLRTLGIGKQAFYDTLMHGLVSRIENPQTWLGQDPTTGDLQFHSGFINTDIGDKAFAIIQALVTRRLKKLGYDVVFYGNHDNFTVVVSIDL